ncbi:MAG: DUF1772 domain-containing protein [Alphaproteobacteria bacterium]
MLLVLEIATVVLVAVAMALALAHALELPGKRRLSREHYLAVQPIYYPGFTIGGLAEPLAGALFLALIVLLPPVGWSYWLMVGAFLMLIAMHAAYWLLTHPVNRFWLRGTPRAGAAAAFFAADPGGRAEAVDADWTALRDRWEDSHVVRAILGIGSLILIVTAVAL